MNITVLGAGAGGTTVAFDCAAHGHQVNLFDFPQFPDNIAAISEYGGIQAEGDISGFSAIAYAGHDIDRALENAKLIESVDNERIAIGERLGLEIFADPEMGMRQGYMLEKNYGSGYRRAPGFLGITAQLQLDHRYLNEDVGYGLVFMSHLGKQAGIETPTIDSIIQLTSVLMKRNYADEAFRTPKSLGIGELTAEQLASL